MSATDAMQYLELLLGIALFAAVIWYPFEAAKREWRIDWRRK